MKKLYQLLSVIVILTVSNRLSTAQGSEIVREDTIVLSTSVDSMDTGKSKEKKGSIFTGDPGKSMLLSLVIPGSGQWYNGSILRAHVAWAAIGGMGYLVNYNTRIYRCRRDAYIASIDGVTANLPSYCADCDPGLSNVTDPATLRILRDDANNARQLSIVGFTLVWVLNGIDAYVDAHLKEFDVDEDLSFEIESKFDDPNAPMRIGLFVQF